MAPKAIVMILALIGAPGSHGLPTVDDELAHAQRNVSAALATRRHGRHGNVPCQKCSMNRSLGRHGLRQLAEFRNLHAGADIYVVASGASMNHVDPTFFKDRIAIGVNQVYRRFTGLRYVVRKEARGLEQAIRSAPDSIHFVSKAKEGGSGNANQKLVKRVFPKAQNVVVFDHVSGLASRNYNLAYPVDGLIVSGSTITSAMHLAAFMGAATIFLAGHDCGTLDGAMHFDGYHTAWSAKGSHVTDTPAKYRAWMLNEAEHGIQSTTIQLKHLLLREYGVHVHSLNPFINFGLEGHSYHGVHDESGSSAKAADRNNARETDTKMVVQLSPTAASKATKMQQPTAAAHSLHTATLTRTGSSRCRTTVHDGPCNFRKRNTKKEAESSPLVNTSNTAWCGSPRLSDAWMAVCSGLGSAWARGSQAVHVAIQSGAKDEQAPHACEGHLTMAMNAGDAFLPIATRMAWDHFLGRPASWVLQEARKRYSSQDFEHANRDSTSGMIVGGGGLFYPANKNSQQSNSGWQFDISSEMLGGIRPPIFLFAVGWNEFRNQKKSKTEYDAAFNRSLDVLLRKPSTVFGLRESYSVEAIRRRVGPELAPRVRYQPCATTLVAAIQPCLGSTKLLDPANRLLSINYAADQPALRFGSAHDEIIVIEQLLLFAERAYRHGWQIHITDQSKKDNDDLIHLYGVRRRALNLTFVYTRISLPDIEDIVGYYRRVTVAASMRGHGVMIPFGLNTATISLVTHEKVGSFIKDIGRPEWGVECTLQQRADGGKGIADDLMRTLTRIDSQRELVHKQMREAQEYLMGVTAANMLAMGKQILQRVYTRSG